MNIVLRVLKRFKATIIIYDQMKISHMCQIQLLMLFYNQVISMLVQCQNQNRHIARCNSSAKNQDCSFVSKSSSGYIRNQNNHSLDKKNSPYVCNTKPNYINKSINKNLQFESPYCRKDNVKDINHRGKQQAQQQNNGGRKVLNNQKYRNQQGLFLHSSEAKLFINNITTQSQVFKILKKAHPQQCQKPEMNIKYMNKKKFSIGSLNSEDAPDLDKLITDLKLSPSLSLSSIQELSKGISDCASLQNPTDQIQKQRSVKLLQRISRQLTFLKEKQEKKSIYLMESQASYLTSNISQEVQTINLLLQSIQKKLTLSKYQQSAASSSVYSHVNSSSNFQNVANGIQLGIYQKTIIKERNFKNVAPLPVNKQSSANILCPCGSSNKKAASQVSPIKQLNEQSSSRILYTNFSLKDIEESEKQNKKDQQSNSSIPYQFFNRKKTSYMQEINTPLTKNINISNFNSNKKSDPEEKYECQYRQLNNDQLNANNFNQMLIQQSQQLFKAVSPFHKPKSMRKFSNQIVNEPTFSFSQTKQISSGKERSFKRKIEINKQQQQEKKQVQRLNQQIKILQKLLQQKTSANCLGVKRKQKSIATLATPTKTVKMHQSKRSLMHNSSAKKFKKT